MDASAASEPTGAPRACTPKDTSGDTVSCPCTAFEGALGRFVRVVVLEREADRVRLRVEDSLGSAPDVPLAPGEEVTARFVGRLPCYRGRIDVAVGDEALALFYPQLRVTQEEWAEVRLTPWAADLLMAKTDEAELFVPASEIAHLTDLDFEECRATYGNWADLPGTACDGETDVYYCVRDGQGVPCIPP